ncbi:hypothetical protein M0R45_030873 [Rubus argutus]|uniref:Uncharacterized protein n=1 Tax=Rubus argutus TaxID=59490 RepID=A0AAW1WFM6_RUBAR
MQAEDRGRRLAWWFGLPKARLLGIWQWCLVKLTVWSFVMRNDAMVMRPGAVIGREHDAVRVEQRYFLGIDEQGRAVGCARTWHGKAGLCFGLGSGRWNHRQREVGKINGDGREHGGSSSNEMGRRVRSVLEQKTRGGEDSSGLGSDWDRQFVGVFMAKMPWLRKATLVNWESERVMIAWPLEEVRQWLSW